MKNDNKKSGIISGKVKTENRISVISVLVSMFASISVILELQSGFTCINGFTAIFMLATAVYILLISFSLKTKMEKYIFPVSFAVLTIVSVLHIFGIREGYVSLINDIGSYFGKINSKIFLPYETVNAKPVLSFMVLSFVISNILIIAVTHKRSLLLVPVLISVSLGVLTGFSENGFLSFICFTGILLAYIYCIFPSYTKKSRKIELKSIIISIAILLVLITSCTLILKENKIDIKENTMSLIHKILYDNPSNAMPEGDFKNLGGFDKSDKEALEVTMESPSKIYLKGYTGDKYNGKGWEKLSSEELLSYTDLFYWLHENGFYGETELGNVIGLADENAKSNVISIKNKSACKKNTYIPYGFSDTSICDPLNIGDTCINGTDEISYNYYPGGYKVWYESEINLSKNQDKKENSAFLSNENAYRDYVYDNYLDVPEQILESIREHLGNTDGIPFNEIRERIIGWLLGNTSYDENIGKWDEKSDFISYFMDMSQTGYSVHYASTAVMMLRSCGIPARYVEGYFLSSEDAAKYKNGDTVILTENNAHAWAEYYLDGAGWIPFEATPGYIDDEFDNSLFTATEDKQQRNRKNDRQPNVQETPKEDELGEERKEFKVGIKIFIIFLIFLILILTAYIIYVRNCFKKAMRKIENSDNREAIILGFGYSEMFKHYISFTDTELNALGYREAFEINKEAIFSNHEIEDKKRNMMNEYRIKLVETGMKKINLIQKLVDKYIKGIC